MNVWFLVTYLILFLIYAYLMVQLFRKLNRLLWINNSNQGIKRTLKQLGVVNLFFPFLMATMAINMYPNLYNDTTERTKLPPVATVFALVCFVGLVLILPYFLKRLIKRGILHKRGTFVNPLSNVFYSVLIYIVLLGITISLTTLISFIERMITGL
jgi:hypothetical protein